LRARLSEKLLVNTLGGLLSGQEVINTGGNILSIKKSKDEKTSIAVK
jgi:hypothetical protein